MELTSKTIFDAAIRPLVQLREYKGFRRKRQDRTDVYFLTPSSIINSARKTNELVVHTNTRIEAVRDKAAKGLLTCSFRKYAEIHKEFNNRLKTFSREIGGALENKTPHYDVTALAQRIWPEESVDISTEPQERTILTFNELGSFDYYVLSRINFNEFVYLGKNYFIDISCLGKSLDKDDSLKYATEVCEMLAAGEIAEALGTFEWKDSQQGQSYWLDQLMSKRDEETIGILGELLLRIHPELKKTYSFSPKKSGLKAAFGPIEPTNPPNDTWVTDFLNTNRT
jgi:hypothetical protein